MRTFSKILILLLSAMALCAFGAQAAEPPEDWPQGPYPGYGPGYGYHMMGPGWGMGPGMMGGGPGWGMGPGMMGGGPGWGMGPGMMGGGPGYGMGPGMMGGGPGYGMMWGGGRSRRAGPGMQGGRWNRGLGPDQRGWQRMAPEQRSEWQKMRSQFSKDTLELRKELVGKQMELQDLWQDENPDQGRVRELSQQISELQVELSEKRNGFIMQCREKFGDQGWSCPGWGWGGPQ